MGLQDRQYYREDSYSSPWSQAPAATQSIVVTLIMINVGVWVFDMFSPLVNDFLSLKPDTIKQPWNLWQLLSHGFAHASIRSKESIFHIGGNMLILFMLGRPVEQRLGRQEFLRFYLIAIVFAGLIWLLMNIGTSIPLIGASGGVTAVVALFIFMYPHSTLLLFGVFPLKAWILGVAIVGMDLLRSLNPESEIAWQAHLAGFALGAAYFHFKWNFHWLKFDRLGKLFKPNPSLKIHRPDATEKLQQQADEILEKIAEHGEESLNARERKILKQYSEQVRRRRG